MGSPIGTSRKQAAQARSTRSCAPIARSRDGRSLRPGTKHRAATGHMQEVHSPFGRSSSKTTSCPGQQSPGPTTGSQAETNRMPAMPIPTERGYEVTSSGLCAQGPVPEIRNPAGTSHTQGARFQFISSCVKKLPSQQYRSQARREMAQCATCRTAGLWALGTQGS